MSILYLDKSEKFSVVMFALKLTLDKLIFSFFNSISLQYNLAFSLGKWPSYKYPFI